MAKPQSLKIIPIGFRIWLEARNVASLYLVLGLLGMLPLVLLTPPFQVCDEQQHFFRAYQLSEFSVYGEVRGGKSGASLPSSLAELMDRFWGTRSLGGEPAVRAKPLARPLTETLAALSIPLEPERREFIEFPGAAFYSPLPYLPQIAAIAVGRALGVGPLGLLYLARLANGLAALLIVTVAVRILPIGSMALLVVGLLPIVLFEFASASPDATTIATAFLFTALAVRARLQGNWTPRDILLAGVMGLVFCSLKPVYAPLLAIGLPSVLQRGSSVNAIKAHALILAIVLGGTALWFSVSSTVFTQYAPGTNLSAQIAGIVGDPIKFAHTVRYVAWVNKWHWMAGAIGLLGWETVQLPIIMYLIPAVALLACLPLSGASAPRLGLLDATWHAILIGVSCLLILVALYLYFTPVGLGYINGVQGRYFVPLAGLAGVALCASVQTLTFYRPSLAFVVLFLVATEVFLTSKVITNAYQVL